MLSTIVMTVIGPDRPGIVQRVSACVADNGGNWLESRMCHLGGQFAGILRVEVPAEKAKTLLLALEGLKDGGLAVMIHTEGAAPPSTGSARTTARIELVGQDRPGILRSISGVLANHGINVEDLSSERVSAPMGGGTLFQARVTVSFPEKASMAAVRADLEKIAADLMVDLSIGN